MLRYSYTLNKGFEPYKNGNFDYAPELLVGMFHDMLRIRIIEERIADQYHLDQMKSPIHLVIGQEASSVGACTAMRKDDLIYSSHRTHGNYLAKGGDLKAMMSELYCRLNGCAASRGGSMHLFDKSVGMAGSSAIVAASIPISTGSALSAQLLKKDYVTTAFFGDAATEEGVHWESVNFAALKKLPVIFFCENNFYSVCSSLEVRQAPTEIHKKAEAFGVRSMQIDGTNVLDVYEATKEALERARNGEGPTYIESVAYRWRGHGGATDDSASGYRDVAEVEHWQNFCPIERFYAFLTELGHIDDAQRAAMTEKFEQEMVEAYRHAEESPNPEEKDLHTHVYAD